MGFKITNPEAERLTREFADRMGVGLTQAVTLAMRLALARHETTQHSMPRANAILSTYGLAMPTALRTAAEVVAKAGRTTKS